MRWSNFFHIYQPPEWNEDIVRRVSQEAYQPLLDILVRHPEVRVTLNITGSLTEQLAALRLDDVLTNMVDAIRRGQIELVGSAMYHPILPLLPENEIRRQITLQHELHRRVFGDVYAPQGFYLPEMAYSDKLEPILLSLGYKWVIVDEGVMGDIGQADFTKRYTTPAGLGIIMRNRHLSDYLSFGAMVDQPGDARRAIWEDTRSHDELVTAMDGENLGHHRHGVDKLWEQLVTDKDMTTATLSEYYRSLKNEQSLTPIACSWSSRPEELRSGIPFGLWNHPENPIHKLQWELTYHVIDTVESAKDDPNYGASRLLLDQALTSDKYWWASASPWWDMTIIIRETQRLADVVTPLLSVGPQAKKSVARIMEQIVTTVELWEKTGLAKKRQATYLTVTHDEKYMGGQKLTT